jgi:hypothetical protein
VGDATLGYIAGGRIAPSTNTSDITRLEFSTETTQTLTSKLSQTKESVSTKISNNSYCYFAGGLILSTPAAFSTIDRLDFSTEIVTTPTSKLLISKNLCAGSSNSSYGYLFGGQTPTPSLLCTIDRLDFSTESIKELGFQASWASRSSKTTSNNFYTYITYSINYCTIDRLEFSTETLTIPSSLKTPQSINVAGSVSNNSYGYYCGGNVPTPDVVCTIDRLDFSTETVTRPSSQLSQQKISLSSIENTSYGYICGGVPPGGAFLSTIDRLDFSTESVSVPITKLPSVVLSASGTQNAK